MIVKGNLLNMITYSHSNFADKISSIHLDKNNYYSGILRGIKGQYLTFSNENIRNIRKYSGYSIYLKF